MRSTATMALASLVIGFASSHAAIASPVPTWTQEFASSGHVMLPYQARPKLTGHPSNGDFLVYDLAGLTALDPIIAKVDAMGTPLWSAQEEFKSSVQRAVALADGSVVVISQSVTRYAADGRLLWTIPRTVYNLNPVTVVEVGGQLVLLSGGRLASRIDRESGLIVETLSGSSASFCVSSNVVVFGSDTIYVDCGLTVDKLRLNPLRLEWRAAPPGPAVTARDGSIAADATGVYVFRGGLGGQNVAKLNQAGGGAMWSTATPFAALARVILDSDGNPVFHAARRVAKFDRNTGALIW